MTTLRTTADHLAHIFRDPVPALFLTPFSECYWLLSRAYKAGWKFRATVAGLEVKKPRELGSGTWRRVTSEGCRCPGARITGRCSHEEVIIGVGGVEVAMAVLRQFDFSGRKEVCEPEETRVGGKKTE